MQPQSSPSRASPRRYWKPPGARVLLFALLGAAALVFLVFGAVFLSDPSGRIRVTEPVDGAVVHDSPVTIRGTSSPDWAGVYRALDNGGREQVAVDEKGNWEYIAVLVEGENDFTFQLDSYYGQSDSVTVFYQP